MINKIRNDIIKILNDYAIKRGYTEEDIADYVSVKVSVIKADGYKDRVRIRVSSDLFHFYDDNKLVDELNECIEKYDNEAYFEAEYPTIWVAYLDNIDLDEYDTIHINEGDNSNYIKYLNAHPEFEKSKMDNLLLKKKELVDKYMKTAKDKDLDEIVNIDREINKLPDTFDDNPNYLQFLRDVRDGKFKIDDIEDLKIEEPIEEAELYKGNVQVKLYQTDNRDYAFMPYKFAKEHNFNIDDYKLVAEFEINNGGMTYRNEYGLLDHIFMLGNTVQELRDKNPKMRSISVSDIISINGNLFYVEPSGFTRIEDKINEAEEIKESSNIIWRSQITEDDYDKEDLKNNAYKDYVDNFDGTIKPLSYDEWLESDWLYNYLYDDFNNEDNEYSEWYDFIDTYSKEDLERYYKDYLDDIKEREPNKPEDFDSWFEDYMNNDTIVFDSIQEDLVEQVLPMIDKQVNDLIVLSGNYNSNYGDFRPSGKGGRLFYNTDEIKDMFANNDDAEVYEINGNIGIAVYNHDGSTSGMLYTMPTDRIEIYEKLGYYDKNIVKDVLDYTDEDMENISPDEAAEECFQHDLMYNNFDYRDFKDIINLLEPIKNDWNN